MVFKVCLRCLIFRLLEYQLVHDTHHLCIVVLVTSYSYSCIIARVHNVRS